MIVELCGTDLLALANGTQVAVGNIIVRPTDKDESFAFHETNASAEAYRNEALGTQAPSNPRRTTKTRQKTGQRWMRSIYPHGICKAPLCATPEITKGDLILFDYDSRNSYCETHGDVLFPTVPKKVEATRDVQTDLRAGFA